MTTATRARSIYFKTCPAMNLRLKSLVCSGNSLRCQFCGAAALLIIALVDGVRIMCLHTSRSSGIEDAWFADALMPIGLYRYN